MLGLMLFPNGKTVIVGHDRSPSMKYLKLLKATLMKLSQHTNDLGGTVILTDTGAGKGGFVRCCIR